MSNCKYCKAECGFTGEDRERVCKGYISMTNADRIRAMTDEELATLFEKSSDCNIGCPAYYHCQLTETIGCFLTMLEWLREPVQDHFREVTKKGDADNA